MFSNLSPAWRRRLRYFVIAWALLLVAAAFFGRQATVHEQADAAEGRARVDETVGVAASALAGTAFEFAVGAPVVIECEITPVRKGVDYLRTFEVYTDEPELAFQQALGAMARHLGLEPPGPGGTGWGHTSADFITARLSLDQDADPESASVRGTVSTGCRPVGPATGTVMPAERPSWITLAEARPGLAAEGAEIVAYGRIECARGGTVETWWWDAGEDTLIPSTEDRCGD